MRYKTVFSQNDYKTIDIRIHGKRNKFYPSDKNDIVIKYAYNSLLKNSHLLKKKINSHNIINLILYHNLFKNMSIKNNNNPANN